MHFKLNLPRPTRGRVAAFTIAGAVVGVLGGAGHWYLFGNPAACGGSYGYGYSYGYSYGGYGGAGCVAALAVTLESHAIRANGHADTTVNVQLKDSNGNDLHIAGQTIDFSTSPQTLKFTDIHDSGVLFTSATTDANGHAALDVIASTHAGVVFVTATDVSVTPTVSGSDRLKLTGTHFSQHTDRDSVDADGSSQATDEVTVVDDSGAPVAGDTVTFTNQGSPGSPAVAQPSVVTDANGNASTTVTASTVPSIQAITATDTTDGVTADNFATIMALTQLPAKGPSNTSFVHNAYVTLLGRDADPSGLTYWVNALNNGTPRWVVSLSLARSDEYRQDVIGGVPAVPGFYQQYLGRPSDAAGVAYWVSQMDKGMTFEQVRLQFINSAEFFADNNNDPATDVTAIYRVLLGRTPDAGGLAFWVANFNPVTIGSQILFSPEGRSDLVSSYYTTILNHAPDAPGLAYWTSALLGGASDENIIASILGSDEYYLSH